MFRANNFDKLLDKATSNLRLDPDWPAILQICDLIRQNDCTPKAAVAAIKKKLYCANPHQAMFALLVLESIVKNCGSGVHDEISTKTNCEMLRDLVKTTPHENIKTKVLELIQAWAFAFRNNPKYRSVQDTVNIMKAEGYKFPALKESDAMFSADTAPQWSDGEVCHRCRVAFTLMIRKHHCRACGQVFCQQCSSKTSTIPKFGIEKEVRVCDACYDKISRPPNAQAEGSSDEHAAAPQQNKHHKKNALNLLNWYKPSTNRGAHQNTRSSPHRRMNQSRPPLLRQAVPGASAATSAGGTATKTAEELQEEEELQLALALSQSEAEQKEKRNYSVPPPAAHHITNTPPRASSPNETATAAGGNSELSRYLDRAYWEQRNPTAPPTTVMSDIDKPHPIVAPASKPLVSSPTSTYNGTLTNSIVDSSATADAIENGTATDEQVEAFVSTLRSQIDIFVNRMKSNSSRGRSIANDTSVQSLFLHITSMHSKLLRFIQKQDDERIHFESLQDKVTAARDSRAALDTLRQEHAEKRAREAEAADRLRQMQMAAKLDAMRRKKHEYLEYQRQLALRRVRDTELQLQQRQEQQKQHYMSQNFYPVYPGQYRSLPPPPPNVNFIQNGPPLPNQPPNILILPMIGQPPIPPNQGINQFHQPNFNSQVQLANNPHSNSQPQSLPPQLSETNSVQNALNANNQSLPRPHQPSHPTLMGPGYAQPGVPHPAQKVPPQMGISIPPGIERGAQPGAPQMSRPPTQDGHTVYDQPPSYQEIRTFNIQSSQSMAGVQNLNPTAIIQQNHMNPMTGVHNSQSNDANPNIGPQFVQNSRESRVISVPPQQTVFQNEIKPQTSGSQVHVSQSSGQMQRVLAPGAAQPAPLPPPIPQSTPSNHILAPPQEQASPSDASLHQNNNESNTANTAELISFD